MPPRRTRRNNYSRKVSEVKIEVADEECSFCKNKEIDETKYGPLYKLEDVVVHYFCILLSSSSVQNGSDNEGIWGFLLEDIKSELQRGLTKVCFYCNQTGANVSCNRLRCDKAFHLPCGLKNGSLHQFFGQYKSFCREHRAIQRVDSSVLNNTDAVVCLICMDDVNPALTQDSLWAPCCKHNTWLHRNCVQKMALSAGYFFKCPMCNNKEIFVNRMLILGIYIPSRDASWELVPNAYSDLYQRPNLCSAEYCFFIQENEDSGDEEESQELMICNTCGSVAVHFRCSSLQRGQSWTCNSCMTISKCSSSAKRKRLISSNNKLYYRQDLFNEEPVASTSGSSRKKTRTPTNEVSVSNEQAEICTRSFQNELARDNEQAQASTNGVSVSKEEAEVCTKSYIDILARDDELAQASTNGVFVLNEQAEICTRSFKNELVQDNEQAQAFTNGVSVSKEEAEVCTRSYVNVLARDNEQAQASTNGVFVSNEQAEVCTKSFINILAQDNEQAQASTNEVSVPNEDAEVCTRSFINILALDNEQAQASTNGVFVSNEPSGVCTRSFINELAQNIEQARVSTNELLMDVVANVPFRDRRLILKVLEPCVVVDLTLEENKF